FFFQAEDGIRDRNVTGVQTCALPISRRSRPGGWNSSSVKVESRPTERTLWERSVMSNQVLTEIGRCRIDQRPCFVEERSGSFSRSEERRVGKECRCRGWGG